MAQRSQTMIFVRRGLMLLAWGLVIAQVTLAIESHIRAQQEAPATFSSKLETRYGLNTNARQVEEEARAVGADVEQYDTQHRIRYVPGQAVVRFRDETPAFRCEHAIVLQGGQMLGCLDAHHAIYLVAIRDNESVAAYCRGMALRGEVEYALPNLLFYAD